MGDPASAGSSRHQFWSLARALPPSALTKFMQFAQPIWLFAGLAACAALLWQFRRFDQRQRVALTQFASARLLPKLASSISTSRRLAKRVLFAVGVTCVFIALARP